MDSLNDVCSGISMDLGRELKTASAFVLFFYFQEVSRKIKNIYIFFLHAAIIIQPIFRVFLFCFEGSDKETLRGVKLYTC